MSIKKRIQVAGLLIFIVCFAYAGKILVVNQQPIRSDVIIILGGGEGERELEASRLYQEHLAPYVIVSNGGTRGRPSTGFGKKEIEWLVQYGVPRSKIIPEFQATNTYENAVYTKKLLNQYHFTSALVVSSSYHMRRGQYIFNKIYEGSGISLSYCAAPVEDFSPEFWWSSLMGWYYTVSEYVKLVGYMVIY